MQSVNIELMLQVKSAELRRLAQQAWLELLISLGNVNRYEELHNMNVGKVNCR